MKTFTAHFDLLVFCELLIALLDRAIISVLWFALFGSASFILGGVSAQIQGQIACFVNLVAVVSINLFFGMALHVTLLRFEQDGLEGEYLVKLYHL